MPYLYVENFEAGLDTRKSVFTAPPGSLRVGENVHVTRGKEIERRKAFASFATLPAGTVGLHAVQDRLFTFGDGAAPGGMPVTVEYQQLTDPDAGTMIALLSSENFAGKIYAVAEFDSGGIHHYYDGTLVADWDTIAASLGTVQTVARTLGNKLDTDGVADVVVVSDTVILSATTAGVAFTVTSANTELTITERQAAVAAQAEVPATASFVVTGGSPGQTFNTISHVSIDGEDLLGSALDFVTDNATTAQAVADRINAGVSSYSASAASATVTVTAPAGIGVEANGREITVGVTGDVTVGTLQDMAGGTDPVPAVPQITDITVDTYGAAVVYAVVLDGTTYKIKGESSGMAQTVRAVKQKMYAVTGSLLYFSGFSGASADADPTQLLNDGANEIGAGFINMSTQYAGSEDLVGLGVYQGRVAVFSRRNVQIWNVDPDPALNTLYQVLLNVGSIAPHSTTEYGDLDIFFLSESGIRSLRSRDSSNLASANDVGVAIDADVNRYVTGISRRQVREAKAVVEPGDSRYLLAIGDRVYVFSNFPGSRVAAWSTYDLGGEVADWAIASSRLYARVGDTVRLYGGLSGDEYDPTAVSTVTLPLLDSSNPAGTKQLQGIDVGCIGTWTVEFASEPNDPDEWETIATLIESTYGSTQQVGANGTSTHFSLRFTSSEDGPALLGNAIIHYRDIESD